MLKVVVGTQSEKIFVKALDKAEYLTLIVDDENVGQYFEKVN